MSGARTSRSVSRHHGSSRKQNTYEVLLRHITDDSEHLYPRRDFRRNTTRHLVRGVIVPEARQSPREQMSLESASWDADRLSTTTPLQLAGGGRGGNSTAKIQPLCDERQASGRGTGKLEVAVVTRRGGGVLSTFCFWFGSDWPVHSFVVCCRSCGVYERNSM
ncbi:hypothetical protein K466DRAFT_298711 [Polyporus arcularius HHB13444]|uniref:Uncharacterized protein n=1 Tax=Polyporus arcularius HHB13444 TaxID=1314778 RepID=A0A5C3NYK0_9APHY|nr:hypothetical protein K466DRAFT_298711 [Polyporus arcularius HHB13444]